MTKTRTLSEAELQLACGGCNVGSPGPFGLVKGPVVAPPTSPPNCTEGLSGGNLMLNGEHDADGR